MYGSCPHRHKFDEYPIDEVQNNVILHYFLPIFHCFCQFFTVFCQFYVITSCMAVVSVPVVDFIIYSSCWLSLTIFRGFFQTFFGTPSIGNFRFFTLSQALVSIKLFGTNLWLTDVLLKVSITSLIIVLNVAPTL